jgi:tetratricopeptide (TPR) repeat protein
LTLTYVGLVGEPDRDLAPARAYLEESIALWREIGDRWVCAGALNNLGEVARFEGNYQQALELYTESMQMIKDLGNRRDFAIPHLNLGQTLLNLRQYEKSAEHFQQSLALSLDLGDRTQSAAALIGLGAVAGGQGELVRAARLFSAGQVHLQAPGKHLDPMDAANYERELAAVRAQLDTDVFDAAWTEGRTWSMEQAVSYALQESVAN